MQLIAVAFAVVVIVSGAIVNNSNHPHPSPTPEPTPSPEVTASATVEASPTATAIPTQTPDPTPEPEPSPTQTQTGEFYYPGASQQSSGEYDLYLVSSDSADKVTDWYQSYIEDNGYNIKNFIKTKVNDEVENRLVGANSNQEIDIEITTSEGLTHIKINY